MKIVMVNPAWNAYSETWLRRMMRYFTDSIVGVACFDPKENVWENGAPGFDLYGRKPAFINKILYRFFGRSFHGDDPAADFIRFVKKTKAEAIFINFIGPALYLKEALKKLKLPVFVHVHGIDIFWNALQEDSQTPVHPHSYTADVLQLTDSIPQLKFIANSGFSENKLKEIGIKKEKIFLKYFGMPVNDVPEKECRESLSVLYLGRFADFKGPDKVLQAFIQACDAGFKGTLTMAGDGRLKPECISMAKESAYASRINFLDPVDEVTALHLFREADIFSMHSCLGEQSKQAEAFGVTVIEAMSQGTPVITANFGGPAEVVKNNYNGILVEPGNTNEHAAAFLHLQNNPGIRKEMSIHCLQTIKDHFSSAQEKKTLEEILGFVKESGTDDGN